MNGGARQYGAGPRRSGGSARGSVPPAGRRGTSTVQPSRYYGICAAASSASVESAYVRLGPFNGPQDALDQRGGADASLLVAGWQVSHLMEAWRYFGSSLHALLRNSPNNALHLGYYAQLRSAMSLFAGSGISVKMDNCFYLDAVGNRHVFRGEPTHKIVWNMWKEWTSHPYARALIGDHIKFRPSISLSAITYAPGAGQSLLDAWGYDLFTGSEDHTERNTASYEPKSDMPTPVMTYDSVEFVRSVWDMLGSVGTGIKFDAALAKYFVSLWADDLATNGEPSEAGKTAEEVIEDVIGRLSGGSDLESEALRGIFLGDVDTTLFALASSNDVGVTNVLARALFLLRIATIGVSRAIELAESQNTECKAWIRNWLLQVGVLGDSDVEPGDVWEDYITASDQIQPARNGVLPSALWAAGIAEHSATLSRAEGFCAWGLPVA